MGLCLTCSSDYSHASVMTNGSVMSVAAFSLENRDTNIPADEEARDEEPNIEKTPDQPFTL